MTPSAPCRAAFSLYALTKTLINSSLVQKHRNIKLSVRKQEKTPPLGNFAVRFFPCTHCQKLSVLSSKIYYTVLSAPTTGHSHCPNHWGKSIINFF